jgi:hypothetical protein
MALSHESYSESHKRAIPFPFLYDIISIRASCELSHIAVANFNIRKFAISIRNDLKSKNASLSKKPHRPHATLSKRNTETRRERFVMMRR